MSESTQHKLSRVRPPRVQITYDVEIGNAIEKKELPFVVGIMADLSKMPFEKDPPEAFIPLKDRAFVEIDRDNFAAVMLQLKPKLEVEVGDVQALDPTAADDQIPYVLEFSRLDDFKPDALVKQLKEKRKNSAVNKLWEDRLALRDMLTKLDGNDALLSTLTDVATSNERLEVVRLAVKSLKEKVDTKMQTLEAPASGVVSSGN